MKLNCKACILTGILAMFLAGQVARAEFNIICGKERAKGLEHSSVAFVDGDKIQFYLNGKEVPKEKWGMKSLEGSWMVSLDRGAGHGTQQFIFTHKDSSVQESLVDDQGKEKKVGKAQKCDWEEPKAAEADEDSDSEEQDS